MKKLIIPALLATGLVMAQTTPPADQGGQTTKTTKKTKKSKKGKKGQTSTDTTTTTK